MKPRTGQTLASTVDPTTVIVVRAPAADVQITCGGTDMVDAKAAATSLKGVLDPSQADGSLLGKRYADEEIGIELLVTKPGQGTLAVDGRALPLKQAKPLPASD